MTSKDVRHQLERARKDASASARNEGTPLDTAWVRAVRVNRSALERRAATLPTRRAVKQAWQAAWQLRAITCLDLTTLAGDDTPDRVRRLCAKARRPVRPDVLTKLGVADLDVHVASVCVYPALVETAAVALRGSGIPVCSVAAGFPAGLTPLSQRVAEIHAARAAGAGEIDIVITRAHVLRGDWAALYDEIRAFREACGPLPLKTILATGDLGTLRNVARASRVALMAGADFIKTSTGKEAVNATLPVSLVMVRAIREYRERTGFEVGFKPAGGIGKARQAVNWLALMKDELGEDWMRPERFRIGASSLLGDLERQLETHATGHYAAGFRQPMA